MRKPLLLDLYCCAGGAAMGYHLAGFEVVGVDIEPQPNYPFTFVQADAVTFAREHGHQFQAIHASPPCQFHSAMHKGNKGRVKVVGGTHIDLLPATRAVLDGLGRPYVLENVQGSTVRRDLTLCGEMFGLQVIRHRYFELGGWTATPPVHRPHRGRVAGMRHGVWYEGPYFAVYGDGGGKGSVAQWQQAMGIDWTDVRREIAEAIPPAYTRFIGAQLLDVCITAVLPMKTA